jgi:hypothetical protein
MRVVYARISSWRFRPRKTGMRVVYARCSSCGGAALPAVTCHVGVNGGPPGQRRPGDFGRERRECGWSTPGSDAAKVVLLGEVLKLR